MRLLPRSDARLAKLAAAGDERAFTAIFERYHQEIYRYCRAILGDSHEAQDALQSTMASALRALPGERREIELRPWLYRIAHNESITLVRRRRRTVESAEGDLPAQPAADAAFESTLRLRALVEDLATLPERQRSALVMRELSGLSHEEIAAAMGVSGGAVRQAVYEARVALQELRDGRAMECEGVRKALSDGDGRVLRGRKLRAHVRGCEACRDFQVGIETRTSDLRLLAPPLSTVAASSVLAGVLGSGAGAGGGALAAGGVGASAIGAKALGLIAASAAIGVGAGTAGNIDLPVLGDSGEPDARSGREASPAITAPAPSNAERAAEQASPSGDPRGEGPRADESRRAKPRDEGRPAGTPASPGAPASPDSAAGGASAAAPAGTGQPETPPGSAVATERSDGQSTTPTTGTPEHAAQSAAAHSNAGGVATAPGKPEK
jgi:RNA polymerase sigma factor (sigma-70 family)